MSISLIDIIWFFFLLSVIIPMLRQRSIETARLRLIRQIEQKRGSRLITLIHRQELLSILGIPLTRFINIEDSEHVLRAIRLTPDDLPIDLVLHTPGGLVLASEQIARAIQRHPAKVTVFVPHYAMSGGTMISLAADEIIMDENAVLGPVDPQLGNFPAASIVEAVRQKGKDKVDDETLIMADISSKALVQVEEFILELLKEKMAEENAREVAKALSTGQWTHDYPITFEKLQNLGLKVATGLPTEIYELMELYPQPPQRRPSVQFIPVPYRGRKDAPGGK
ncbi:SDH family Clp fold serine proteinase [Desulforudis sp. 1088]|uniref:SDH family Clp fold serine proteinase n=1 Tax=unclassified Candidatus Desulforudis TaxID=2635950 RepID=UPI003CE56ADF